MKLFKANKEKKQSKPIVVEEPVKETANIELGFNEEEKAAVKFFELSDNFTKEELEKKYNEYNSGTKAFTIEETTKQIKDKKDTLEFYLYKKERFSELFKTYFTEYKAFGTAANINLDSLGIIKNREGNTFYDKEIIASDIVFSGARELEKILIKAKTKEEVDANVYEYEKNIGLFLIELEFGKYAKETNGNIIKEEYRKDKDNKEILLKGEQLKDFSKGLWKEHNERQKYFFDGCQTASKEELLEAFKKIANDEKYVKRKSEIYKKMTSFYGQMIVSKNIEYVRKAYAIIINEILNEYEKNKEGNNFSYSPNNNHQEDDNNDDTLTDESGKQKNNRNTK